MSKRLDLLKVGEKAKIDKILCTGAIRRRLLDMGFIKDMIVESILKSPSGGMKAYSISGALIALRDSDAKNIYITNI